MGKDKRKAKQDMSTNEQSKGHARAEQPGGHKQVTGGQKKTKGKGNTMHKQQQEMDHGRSSFVVHRCRKEDRGRSMRMRIKRIPDAHS